MIVCDVNIWYRLTEEVVEKNSLSKKLVCTHTTLVELNKSHVLYERPEEIKNAIRNIEKFGVVRPPVVYEYGLSKLLLGYRPAKGNAMFLWDGLIKYLNTAIALSETDKREIRAYLKSDAQELDEATSIMNKMAAQIQARNKGNDPNRRNDMILSKRFISQLLIQYYQIQTKYSTSIGISLNQNGWSEMELFLEVWNDWFRSLDFRDGKKIYTNDWADVLNLMYVGPQEQYWTNDNSWVKFILGNPRTAQYLFQPK